MTNNKDDVKVNNIYGIEEQEIFVQRIRDIVHEELEEYKKEMNEHIKAIIKEQNSLWTELENRTRIMLLNRGLLKTIINTIGCSYKEMEIFDEDIKKSILEFGILSSEEYERKISIAISDRMRRIKKTLSNKDKRLEYIRETIKKRKDHKLTTDQIMNLCDVDDATARRYMKRLENSHYPGEKYTITKDKGGRGKPKLCILFSSPYL